MKKRKSKIEKVANPAYAEAMRELRRSSAASPHVPAPRKGTRSVKKRLHIREGLSQD